ncbi:MAG: DMT family transporter [SAR324 cluster bacterium]|nr:DMT family transporter [SAR324 cluster bacterium]
MDTTETPRREEAGQSRVKLGTAYFLMVLAMACWAGNWLLGRVIHNEVPPITLNFWRWVVALFILLPLTWRQLREGRSVIRREWKFLAVLGILGVSLFHSLVYIALNYTTAINAAMYASTTPVIIVAISWGWFREPLALRQIAGIILSLLGVLGILFRGDPALILGLQFNPGDLWAISSILVWAVFTVLLKHRPMDLEALPTLTVMTIIGLVALTPFYLWEAAGGRAMIVGWTSLATIGYMGVFASVIAFTAWNAALPVAGAIRAGLFVHLLPAFTTVFAIVLLSEPFLWYHASGISLVALGIYLATRNPRVEGQALKAE